MGCKYSEEDVIKYIKKQMTAEEEKEFVEHLGACDSCRDAIIKNS